jgi:dTMP kinase
MSGLFISFEGSEGSGKTTQIGLLAERLIAAGHNVLVTREPGGTRVGESIRHLLKYDSEGNSLCPEAELLLFAASRAQLVREVIDPALKAGKTVLCDRYLDSTTVYQGVARRISDDPVQMINRFAVGERMPHLTVVVDVPASVGLERARQRASDLPDRMERENIEFYDAVREGYLLLARNLTDRFIVVDGTRSIESVNQTIWEQLCVRLTLSGDERCQ